MSRGRSRISQAQIVLGIAIVAFVAFSIVVPDFLSTANVSRLIQNVSILGILAMGMALSILGRGIDLSMVASMAVSVAWMLAEMNAGNSFAHAFLLALIFSILIGLINGVLIAYVEVPPIFATLAMGSTIYGFGRVFLLSSDVNYLPNDWQWLNKLATAAPLGIPVSVLCFAAICAIGHLFLRGTREGRYIYMMGDNPQAARITGVPIRLMIVAQYVLTSLVALMAGLLMASLVGTMNTRIVGSTYVYDIILIAVIGGISLSGGRGGATSVIVGTLLIGILLNGMTMMNLSYTTQNVVKALILLAALTIDTLVNPKDEQTSQQGDI
jgi:ribose transport system permease protein|tara:strand:+ start:477 stop:1454 length:978 start_codon:yes stop_codon:yes gene_type:complete